MAGRSLLRKPFAHGMRLKGRRRRRPRVRLRAPPPDRRQGPCGRPSAFGALKPRISHPWLSRSELLALPVTSDRSGPGHRLTRAPRKTPPARWVPLRAARQLDPYTANPRRSICGQDHRTGGQALRSSRPHHHSGSQQPPDSAAPPRQSSGAAAPASLWRCSRKHLLDGGR